MPSSGDSARTPSDAGLGEELRELVVRASSGDRDAFATLARRVTPLIFARARAILRNDAHAEDVVQLVLVKIWQNSHHFDAGRGSVLAWVTTLTRNTSIDRVRSEERVERKRQAAVKTMVRDQTDVDDSVEVGLTRQAVRDALAALPEVQREAVELAYFGGLTYVEVAERLDMPEGTIKSRIRRAMLTLAELLEDES